jgi:hypothetical protein
MATPWAEKHRQRAAEAKSAKVASPGSAEEWLAETIDLDGHLVERWKIGAAVMLAFFIGPGALGYGLLLLTAYYVYTRMYLKGITPTDLWNEYTNHAAELSKKNKPKKGKRK